MKHRPRFLWLIVLPFLVLPSCKPGTPDDVLPAGEMEDVLYDYHVAQALAQQATSDSMDYYVRLYQQAVFDKHGLDAAAFDRSMVWYERHTEQLNDIYTHLAERLGDASASRGDAGQVAGGMLSASGDTLNIWKGSPTILLHSKGVNHYVHSERADTAIHAGDRLQWSFFVNWYYHEGEREATACMTVHYAGDSIATVYQRLSLSGERTLTLRVGDRKVERVECFVYQNAPWSERPRLLTLSGVSLYRMRTHEPKQPKAEQVQADTTAKLRLNPELRIRDSLLRQDTMNRRRSHFR